MGREGLGEGLKVELERWFARRIPEGWFLGPPEVAVDGEEILVVGRLREPAPAGGRAGETAGGATDQERGRPRTAAGVAYVKRFREETREQRIAIAQEAERRFGRKVSWGADCGELRRLFTTLSVPVMTRLRMPERTVLDTLVAAGVARSRSDALAWCVRLVGRHEGDWIRDLQEALVYVKRVRAEGPTTI